MTSSIDLSWADILHNFYKKVDDPNFIRFGEKRAEDLSLWGQTVCLGSLSRLSRSTEKNKEVILQIRQYYQTIADHNIVTLIKIVESTIFSLYIDFASNLITHNDEKNKVSWMPLLDLREEIACTNEVLRYNEIMLLSLRQFDSWCQEKLKQFKVNINVTSTPILNLARRTHHNWWLGTM